MGSGEVVAQDLPQTQADDYTRYELQAPGSAAFRIFYDVTATTPGKVLRTPARRSNSRLRGEAEASTRGVSEGVAGVLIFTDRRACPQGGQDREGL